MSQTRVRKLKKLALLACSFAVLAVGAVLYTMFPSSIPVVEAASDYAETIKLKIEKAYYEKFENDGILPTNQVYAGDDITYVLTVTNISTAPFSHTGSIINVDDELSPDVMSDVQVTAIWLDSIKLDDTEIKKACNVSNAYILHCGIQWDLYTSGPLTQNPNGAYEGSKISIHVKAKATVHGNSKAYELHNRAYVYSAEDVGNSTVITNPTDEDKANGGDCTSLIKAKSIPRCRSADIVFCVVTPELKIDKKVNKNGRVLCYYYLSAETKALGYLNLDDEGRVVGHDDYVSIKDLTEVPGDYQANCMNEDGGTEKYSIEEAAQLWPSASLTEDSEYRFYSKARDSLTLYCTTNPGQLCIDAVEVKAKELFIAWKIAQDKPAKSNTRGYVDDQSVGPGERVEYEITVKNYGSAPTKTSTTDWTHEPDKGLKTDGEDQGIYIYDQFDPLYFENDSIYVQPITGGVTCKVEHSKLTCFTNRPLAPYTTSGTTQEATGVKCYVDANGENRCDVCPTIGGDCVKVCGTMVECQPFIDSGWGMDGEHQLGNLPTNDAILIRVSAIPKQTGEINNMAYVGGGGDLMCPNDTTHSYCHSEWATARTFVTAPELHINKELRNGTDADMGTTIVKGTEAKYVIKVTNEGTADTKGMIVVHDVIPDFLEVNRTTLSLSFDDASYGYATGFCEFRGTSARELYCRAYDTIEGGLLHRSGVWTIEFNVRVLEDAVIDKQNSQIVNYAYVYGGKDPVCENEETLLTIKQAFNSGKINPYDRCYDYLGTTIVAPKLTVTKGVDKTSIVAGEKSKYWVNVENKGDYATTAETTVVDYLPEGVVAESRSIPSGCTYDEDTGTITCTIPAGFKKGGKQIFNYTVKSTRLSGQLVNSVLIYNPDDSACSTDAAAMNTTRCHASVSTSALSPVLKIETTASALEVYKGGQVSYLTSVKNIGNYQSTADSVVTIQMPVELRLLGVRSSSGTCRIDLHYFVCTVPAGIQPGQSVYISTLARATEVTGEDTIVRTDLYGGGDPDCVNPAEIESLSRIFGPKVFAEESDPVTLPADVDPGTTTDPGNSTEDKTDSGADSGGSVYVPPTITPGGNQPITPAEPDTTTNARCACTASIRIIEPPEWATDISGGGAGAPSAGIMSTIQALGTISMLGVASFMVLKSRKDFQNAL